MSRSAETSRHGRVGRWARMRSRTWIWFALFGAFSITGYALLPEGYLRIGWYLATGLCFAAGAFVGPRLHRSPNASGFVVIGVCVAVATVSDVLAATTLVGAPAFLQDVAGVLNLLVYLPYVIWMIALAHSWAGRNADNLVDVGIVAIATGIVLWTIAARPTLGTGADASAMAGVFLYTILQAGAFAIAVLLMYSGMARIGG